MEVADDQVEPSREVYASKLAINASRESKAPDAMRSA
jgi:hypothetical protein